MTLRGGTFNRCDGALVAAFVVIAVLGTWNRVLLINEVYLVSVGWLGDAWDLYFNLTAGRALSFFAAFGPAWAIRWLFGVSADSYITLAHALYFAMPLGLWLAIRAVEPGRAFSRLYLAAMLVLVYMPTEVIFAAGVWTIWAALLVDPKRPWVHVVLITLGLALIMAFTHPALALMSLVYLGAGGVLTLLGRPFPRRALTAAAAMALLLFAAYAATSHLLRSTNPTIAEMQAAGAFDYIDPGWMLATLIMFPVLAIVYLLLLAPGAENVNPRWRMPALAVVIIGLFGLWFAANGTSLYTYVFARHTVLYALALALALAVAGPATWLAQSERPLVWCSAIAVVAALSYNVDIVLYGRFVDRHLEPGVHDVDQEPRFSWPQGRARRLFEPRLYFKWLAGQDYVRDVVVPDYERYRQALAFYSFFRSDRRSVLYHRIPPGNWIPFECVPVERALAGAHDDLDRQFLKFLSEHYCVR